MPLERNKKIKKEKEKIIKKSQPYRSLKKWIFFYFARSPLSYIIK